jgi:hypothetical protein
MSDSDPLATVLGGRTCTDPDGGPPRTLGGALVTVALFVVALLAVSVPTALSTALLTAVVAASVAGFVVGLRRRRCRKLRLCLPRTRVCIRL